MLYTVRQNQFAVDNSRDRSNLYWHPATAVRGEKKTKREKKPITKFEVIYETCRNQYQPSTFPIGYTLYYILYTTHIIGTYIVTYLHAYLLCNI